jgi:glycosyltransferase involved in cell wall biosynthesis
MSPTEPSGHDVGGMASAICAVLQDRPQAEAMGRAGRARVEARLRTPASLTTSAQSSGLR